MAKIKERKVILVSKDDDGATLIDFPLTHVSMVEGLEEALDNVSVDLSGYVKTASVGNAANKIPVYNAAGHLVLPSGAEVWVE